MHGISRLGLADDPIFTGIYGDMRAGHRHRSSGNVILCESGASGDNQRLVVRNLHRIAAIKAGDPNGLGSGAVGIEGHPANIGCCPVDGTSYRSASPQLRGVVGLSSRCRRDRRSRWPPVCAHRGILWASSPMSWKACALGHRSASRLGVGAITLGVVFSSY
jgi:hypothetical protein